MEEIKNGVISEIYSDSDYILSGGVNKNDIPKAKHIFDELKIQYQQQEVSDMCCTITGCMTAFSNLTGYVFSLDERKKLWEQAKTLGASEEYGWYLNKAVDLIREYVNNLGIGKFTTFQVSIGFDDYYNVLKQGYMVITGYSGNSKYNKDVEDNGVLDNIDFGVLTYSHIITDIDNSPDTKNQIYVVNSYPKTSKYNVYKIPNIIPLYQNNTLFKKGYVFAYEDIEVVLDKKLIEKCKGKIIAVVKTKDGTKASGELFYCDLQGNAYSLNSIDSKIREQMLKDSSCINIFKEDLINFNLK